MQIMQIIQVITGGRVFSFSFPASFFCEAFSDDTNQYLRVRVLPMCYHTCFISKLKVLSFISTVYVSALYSKLKAS